MDFDAIVIGAGPAGSSTAFALAQLGWAVAIVEKSEFPRRKVCGEFLSATNLSLLARFGLDKTWRGEAGPEVRRVGLFAAGSRIEAPMPRSPDGGYGRALGRDRLDGLLLNMAGEAGAVVFQPWQAVRATAEGDVQALRIVSGREEMSLRAPVVIGAHGSWEPGKLQSQLERTFKSSDLFGFKAHFTSAQMEADLMPLLLFPGGYGGMVWSDRGHLSVSCCIRRDMLAELRKAPGCSSAGEAVQRHVMASCRGVADTLKGASIEGNWLAAGPIRPSIRPRYADDIFRVGNAAGEAHPLIAEGISMAMQSGWLLASELACCKIHNRAARQRAGQRYSARWRRQFVLRIGAADLFARIAAFPRSADIVGPLVTTFPKILTLGAELSGKSKIVPAWGDGR
jgi:menaquinone-9 beta-reductase